MQDAYEQHEKNRKTFELNEHRNVFVILRYAGGKALTEIEKAIKSSLRAYGLNAVLARDVSFDDELWPNIRFCMDHSSYAIVVFERIVEPDYNPNVALELGYMLALRRRCLILKDKSLPSIPSDIVGRLYMPFDSYNPAETVSEAVVSWLQRLGHTPGPSARTITAENHLEANKQRTIHIIEALNETEHFLRQAASLSSLAISDNEAHEQDDGKYHELLLTERQKIEDLLIRQRTIRIIICPDVQIERVELGLVSEEYAKCNVLPRYDKLIETINQNINNERFQIVFTLRLPHDNLLIIDDKVVFIGRKRRRDRGFPYTTQVFDLAVARDEIAEFDTVFHENVSALLLLDDAAEADYGSSQLKKIVVNKLKESKRRIIRLLKRNHSNKRGGPRVRSL